MTDDPTLFRKLVEASTDGMWLLDGEGATLYANPRMAELLGRTPEEMASLSAYDVHDEPGKQQFAEHMRQAREGNAGHDDRITMYLRPDGTPVWLLASWRPVRDDDGSVIGYLHLYSDYTERRELIDALHHREKQLAEAQAIAAIGSWSWEVATDHVVWSEQLYRMYGTTPAEFDATYAGFLGFIHPDDRDAVNTRVATVFQGEDEFDFDARIIRQDGELRWVRGLGRAERDADGAVVRMVGTAQDVSAEVQAGQEISEYTRRLALLRQVAEAANQSTSLVETLTRSAEALSATPGWEPLAAFVEDHDGELTPIVIADPELPWTQQPDAELARRAWSSQRVEHIPVIGREQTHSLVAIPILHGRGVACVVQLIGDEVPPDDASRDLMSQIATQLGRVAERERAAAELAEARDQAMEASRLKSEFLATMSHEIRTPMNGVIGLNELLLDTTLDSEQRRLAEALHGAGHTLRGIINDILDLSKIEAGKLELELVDFEVRRAVEQSVDLLRGQAREKGLALELDVAPEVPDHVRGDAVRWSQILANLASNAVKFTDHGRVGISVDVEPAEPGRIVLAVTVADTGPGIPDAARARLFDAFTQADPSTTRRHGGTGLGLTIAQQLVDALGGELTLESTVGIGSTFRFTATFADAQGESTEPATYLREDRPTRLRSHRLLVVEDNHVNQLVAVGLLENAGYEADVAVDGVEAVAALSGDHGYAAVLMDCRMPRMDGFAATRAIRAQESAGRHVPIIAMTASALEGERERCLEAGMDDFLTKPVDSARLSRVIGQWINGSSPSPEAAAAAMPAPVPEPEPAEEAVVDQERIEMLHEMVKDGVSLFQRSSGNFITNAPHHLSAIGAAVQAEDAEELTATAHKLKGSALNLGLPRVGAAALELEEQGRTGALADSGRAFATLSHEMHAAVAALERERAARS